MKKQNPPVEFVASPAGNSLIIGPSCLVTGSISYDGRGYAHAIRFLQDFGKHYHAAVLSAASLISTVSSIASLSDIASALSSLNKADALALCKGPVTRRVVCSVAIQLANCVFGIHDNIPDIDTAGNFHPEYVPCALRGICPYNGYQLEAPRNSICNPVYDLGLQPREARLASILVTTSYSLADIAARLQVTESALRQRAIRLYRKLGVDNREHLCLVIQGRRVA